MDNSHLAKDNTPFDTEHALSFLTFDDVDLLRASRIQDLMSGLGRIFSSRVGSETTFELSRPVPYIDWFLSHNWSTPRGQKFMALALFFNLRPAIVASQLAFFVFFGISLCVDISWYEATDFWSTGNIFMAPYCFLIALFCFPCLIVFWHDLRCVCCRDQNSKIFLDKTCIHQTNVDLKAEGIRSLAAYLRASKGIAIIYTDLYFQRLWTVYEIASVILVNPEAKLVLLPIFLSNILCVMYAFELLVYSFIILCQCMGFGFTYRTWAVFFMTIEHTWFIGCMRWWAKKQRDMQYTLKQFSLCSAACACENDRILVQGNIIRFLRHVGLIGTDTTDIDALTAFDTLVRDEMPKQMSRIFGATGIPYTAAIGMYMPFFAHCMDTLIGNVHAGSSPFLGLCEYALLVLIMTPTFVVFDFWLARCCLNLSRLAELAFVISCGIVGQAALLARSLLRVTITAFGNLHSSVWNANAYVAISALLLISAMEVAIAWFLYRPQTRRFRNSARAMRLRLASQISFESARRLSEQDEVPSPERGGSILSTSAAMTNGDASYFCCVNTNKFWDLAAGDVTTDGEHAALAIQCMQWSAPPQIYGESVLTGRGWKELPDPQDRETSSE